MVVFSIRRLGQSVSRVRHCSLCMLINLMISTVFTIDVDIGAGHQASFGANAKVMHYMLC